MREDLPSIWGSRPCTECTFETKKKKKKRNPSDAVQSRLNFTCLLLPRTCPSTREPNLQIFFHMAWYVTPVYDWPCQVGRSVRKETRYLFSPGLGYIRRSGGEDEAIYSVVCPVNRKVDRPTIIRGAETGVIRQPRNETYCFCF